MSLRLVALCLLRAVSAEDYSAAPTGTMPAAFSVPTGTQVPDCTICNWNEGGGILTWTDVENDCKTCDDTSLTAHYVALKNTGASYACAVSNCADTKEIASAAPTGVVDGNTLSFWLINAVASLAGDPHLHGFDGDRTDLRGVHGETYCLLSAPGVSFGMTTRNADFMLPRQEVHGSFFTEAYFVLRTKESGDTVRVFANASDEAVRFELSVDRDTKPGIKKFGRHRRFVHEDVQVECKEVKLFVTTPDWKMTLTRRKINEPLGEIQYRFDVSMAHLHAKEDLVDQVWPHGLLGQTLDGDGTAVDGKMDVYDNAGPEFTTTAMAEGFIEGTAQDYVLKDPFWSPDFKYSRFYHHEATPPRDATKLDGTRHATKPGIVLGAGSTEVEAA